MKTKLDKWFKKKISFLNEYPLRPLHTHGSSSSMSTYSTPRHQLSSPTRSKGLFRDLKNDTSFEPMPKFHDKPIF